MADIRVLIADDYDLNREGFRGLIDSWEGFSVVGGVADGLDAVTFCRTHEVDLVLMDVSMPVMDGVEACGHIVREFPEVIVVMLTISSESDDVLRAIEGGARGYILKDTSVRELRFRLERAMAGESIISEGAASSLVDALRAAPIALSGRARADAEAPFNADYRQRAEQLSERERTVLAHLACGLSNEEIAQQMYLSVGSIKRILSILQDKLNVENRVQLAVFATQAGLID